MAPSKRAKRALNNPSYLRVANIIGIKYFDSDNDVDAIERYLRKNGDPYENALREANQRAEQIRNQSVQDLNRLTQNFGDRINWMNRNFSARYREQQDDFNRKFNQAQETSRRQFESFAKSAEDRYNTLNDVLLTRTNEFNANMERAEARYGELQGTYQETQRLARNQANSFVPDANPGAQTALAGDDRARFQESQARKTKQKELSNLSVLTGIGQQANPLAGLQIA